MYFADAGPSDRNQASRGWWGATGMYLCSFPTVLDNINRTREPGNPISSSREVSKVGC